METSGLGIHDDLGGVPIGRRLHNERIDAEEDAAHLALGIQDFVESGLAWRVETHAVSLDWIELSGLVVGDILLRGELGRAISRATIDHHKAVANRGGLLIVIETLDLTI